MYAYICEKCGAHLDPGERCDCLDKQSMPENVDRKAQITLITEQLCNMSDKNIKIVKSFVKGLIAREILERE